MNRHMNRNERRAAEHQSKTDRQAACGQGSATEPEGPGALVAALKCAIAMGAATLLVVAIVFGSAGYGGAT